MEVHPVSYERLLAFASEELPPHEADQVASHVGSCPGCSGVVARYRAVRAGVRQDAGREPSAEIVARAQAIFRPERRAAPEREPSILEKILATLTFDSRSTLALAGVRGESEGYRLSFESPEAVVDLQVFPPAGPESEAWHLIGQVEAAEGTARSVSLCRGDDEVTSADLAEDRMFDLAVESGSYELRLEMPGRVVVMPNIEIP